MTWIPGGNIHVYIYICNAGGRVNRFVTAESICLEEGTESPKDLMLSYHEQIEHS